jgi:hypothetical protein
MNKNETVVIAAFNDEAAVESAIDHLREWDKRVEEVKLGVIGRVHKDAGGVVRSEVVHGGLFHRAMPISDKGVTALAQELSGRIGLVVACDDYEAEMVCDSLKRDGGTILINSYERTPEEAAKHAKQVADAQTEAAIQEAVRQAKQSPNRDYIEPPA